MRNLLKNFCSLALLTGLLFACNPNEPIAQSVGDTQFEANFKGVGTAFYTIDGKTGQLSYMLDNGEDAGNWRKFGDPIRKSGSSKLFFKAQERNLGASFYAVDRKNGQLVFMLDYGEDAGTWTAFGDPLLNVTISEFEANASTDGMIFYIYDGVKKQTYFMQDFGEKAGKWIPYGNN